MHGNTEAAGGRGAFLYGPRRASDDERRAYAYLRQRGNGSLPLSRMILDGYAAEHGAQLHITERSMATELLIHAYLDGIFDRWMRAGEAHGHQDGRLYKTAKRLKNATAVIDMGERSVDANRWVFDLLAHGYGILCFLLGSRA